MAGGARALLAGLGALTLALAGCGTDDSAADGPVTVYVSLPLSGPASSDGRDAADGARLALQQAEGRAGDLEVRAEFLDDAAPGRAWDPDAVGRNARRAAQDSSTAAYIGELDSEPTRASAPITNDAGIAQISPGAGALDLTAPAEGYPDSPDRYRPSDQENFARVIPSDEVLAHAAARRAAEQGLISVASEFDPADRWQKLTVEEFEEEARAEGLQPGPRRPRDASQGVLTPSGQDQRPFLQLESERGIARLTAALDPSSLPAAGRRFADSFRQRFGREPGPYAAYGYEGMSAALAAIEQRGGDGTFRKTVVDALFGLERPDSVLGAYTVQPDGDTTLCEVQAYESPDGAPDGTVCAPG